VPNSGFREERSDAMKKIEAIIRPEKLPVVKAALEETGYPGMTITEVRGHGVQKGVTQQWRGREFVVEFLPKVKVEVVVSSDGDVDRILALIHDNARTGEIGDGKVFVTEIADVMRVRTGERGEVAI
jgi:nitrogen regulatory protein P-II 1